nr:T9SS type A sorting domain-containing protein [Fibrobacterota bacterium]
GLPSDWTGDYYAVLSDGNTLYTQPGMWRESTKRPIYSSPESDGLTWAPYNGGSQVFSSGIYNGVYDKKNQILYTANWMSGVWALKPLNPGTVANRDPKDTKAFMSARQGIVINSAMNVSRVNFVDLHGRIVKSRAVTRGLGSTIGFDGLQPGIYTVVMLTDGVKVSTTKIVVDGNR